MSYNYCVTLRTNSHHKNGKELSTRTTINESLCERYGMEERERERERVSEGGSRTKTESVFVLTVYKKKR